MLGLKDQIFGELGYSPDLKLSNEELNLFRQLVNDHWLSTINTFHPELHETAQQLTIENYHQIEKKLDHHKLWPKSRRVLPQSSVESIKTFPFITILQKEFGNFSISDIYDTKQHYGKEEIYWRLTRPGFKSDIGPLHKDKWFHGAFNSGYGMFSDDEVTVKLWIPLFCESGESGLAIAPGSHLKEWKYHIEVKDGVPRPVPDEDLTSAGARLIPTEPGNILIFNEGILHGGIMKNQSKTRVSVEITMVLPK